MLSDLCAVQLDTIFNLDSFFLFDSNMIVHLVV